MQKAYYKGHCQVCGRLQKLPGQVLSKHGYTVDWGYFNGVCRGSDYKPFELDKALAEHELTAARENRARLERMAKAELDRTDNRVWVTHGGIYKKNQIRMQVDLFEDENGNVFYFYDDESHEVRRHGFGLKNILEKLREAEHYRIMSQVRQLDHYITWQKERTSLWSVKPLIEITSD